MYSLEILLASIATSAAVATLVTYWFHSSSATKKQAQKVETELEKTREAFEAYRKEVLEEFSATASKFKALNTSYVDLHQQLARSANTLCGEAAANTLLDAPIVPATSQEEAPVTTPAEPVEVEMEFEPDPVALEEASELTKHEESSTQTFIKH